MISAKLNLDSRKNINIPEEIMCYNNERVDGVQAFYAVLKRFTYQCRFIDIIKIVARPIPQCQ